MFSNPDFWARCGRIGLRASMAALAAAALTACGSTAASKSAEESSITTTAQPAAERSARANPGQPAPPLGPANPLGAWLPDPAADAVARMLSYADRVRVLPPAELNQEVARLGSVSSPADQLQLALVLSQLHQNAELQRAQELLARLLGNTAADAQALHPLARLLAARYGEQRRLEEQLEKQNQQLREVQRRLDQTNERLEALKAIERSLTSRSPALAPASPASAPADRVRSKTP
ncbi:hypothetical protein [Polaromonas jejuensis]|uniref:Lipoprotein n=1 Tax=Polaromonas jejuensis TaxID=457502 RepID=A0ABW0Q6L4_9BURK|nr:hypothetical protein [Polaromonas jejuensis]